MTMRSYIIGNIEPSRSPFDGSGNFTRTQDWTNDAAAAIKIRADRHDSNDDDFAAGLSNCITKNGQTTITADIPLNGHKLTGVANPTNAQDAATKGYGDGKYVAGPASAVDNALARFDLTTGKLIQNSGATVDDAGLLTTPSINLATSGQSSATFQARGKGPNTFEWGHSNQAGYGSTIGFGSTSGNPFIGLHCEAGTTANTYLTRGIRGTVIVASSALGGLQVLDIPTAAADNQAGTQILGVDSSGHLNAHDMTTGNTGVDANTNDGCVMINDGRFFSKKAGTAAGNNHFTVYNNANSGTPAGVGSITSSGSATQFNTSSDENLKQFIGPYDPLKAIEIIRADPVRDFNWISSGEYAVGWGAQTSYAVSPDLATPPSMLDAIRLARMQNGADDGSEPTEEEIAALPKPGEPGYVPWGMDLSKRAPYVWAALSWALDRIDELTSRVAALEAAP